MLEKSRKKTSCIVAILIALLLIAVLLPILSFAEPGRVNTEKGKLNLRKKPEDGARLVTTIPNGSSIDVLSYADGWYQIEYRGKNWLCEGTVHHRSI